MRKIIISVAPVAGPKALLPELLIEDLIRCEVEGASVCHLHCKTREGKLTSDITLLSETFDLLREKTKLVVQASTGGISDMTIEERCYPLKYPYVESASLNGGSTNLGEAIYKNSLSDIRYCARMCYEKGIIPEVEVFDIGMIQNVESLREECEFRNPLLYNLVFGHRGGIQATIPSIQVFQSFVPQGSLWGITDFNRNNWTFIATAIAMGATVIRIGFEDSDFVSEGCRAEYNWELVKKVRILVEAMGLEVATSEEARQILGIVKK